jgi:O-antigen/teichoic acid export membrane protein
LIHRILLTRELRFKALSIIALYSALGSGIAAVLLALSGAGVWSIVLQTVLSSVLPIPVLWRTTRWTPRFRFSREAFNEIFGFSMYDALQRTLSYLSRNVDTLLVGKMLGSELLGFYSFAYTLTDVFRQHLMSVLNKVMFPVYGQLQEDIRAVKSSYLRVVKYNTLLITPIMLLLIYYAGEVVPLFFGEKWLPAVVPVQAMAAASIIHAIGGTSDSVLKGLGRFKLNFRITAIRIFLVIIPVFFVGVYFWGILGAAAAVVVRKLFTRFIYQYHLRKVINVTEMELLRSVKSAFIGAFVTIPVYFLFELAGDLNMWLLAAAGLSTGITYLVVVWLQEREELKWAAGRFLQLVRRNKQGTEGESAG